MWCDGQLGTGSLNLRVLSDLGRLWQRWAAAPDRARRRAVREVSSSSCSWKRGILLGSHACRRPCRVWGSPAVIGASKSANRLRPAEQRSGSAKDGELASMGAPSPPCPAHSACPHLAAASSLVLAASAAAAAAITHPRRRYCNSTGERRSDTHGRPSTPTAAASPTRRNSLSRPTTTSAAYARWSNRHRVDRPSHSTHLIHLQPRLAAPTRRH